MRYFLIAALGALIPVVAAAQQPPSVYLMPASLLATIRQYLGARPHDEVAGMITTMEACAALQLRDVRETTGGCRAVSDQLAREHPQKPTP